MNQSSVRVVKSDINSLFLVEKEKMLDLISSEMHKIKNNKESSSKCSMEMLKDAGFVVNRGIEDLMSGLNERNLKDRCSRLEEFKESFEFCING